MVDLGECPRLDKVGCDLAIDGDGIAGAPGTAAGRGGLCVQVRQHRALGHRIDHNIAGVGCHRHSNNSGRGIGPDIIGHDHAAIGICIAVSKVAKIGEKVGDRSFSGRVFPQGRIRKISRRQRTQINLGPDIKRVRANIAENAAQRCRVEIAAIVVGAGNPHEIANKHTLQTGLAGESIIGLQLTGDQPDQSVNIVGCRRFNR